MLTVRLLHVVAMATVVGGSALVWGVVEVAARARETPSPALPRTYEWLFWGAIGVLVMTGVGNLGAFGRGLPGVETTWGTVLAVKLACVLVLLALSAVRTLIVSVEGVRIGALRIAYGGTTVWLLGIVALAEVLAHG